MKGLPEARISLLHRRMYVFRRLSGLLIKVGAAEKVATGAADELATAVLETGGAGGAEDLMVLLRGVQRAG